MTVQRRTLPQLVDDCAQRTHKPLRVLLPGAHHRSEAPTQC